MDLTEYYNLLPIERIAVAKEEATLKGLPPAAVYAFLEKACSHFDQDKINPNQSELKQIKAIKAVEAVTRVGSITKAAKELGVSRSSIYRQMAIGA